jgi:hypothetical protein
MSSVVESMSSVPKKVGGRSCLEPMGNDGRRISLFRRSLWPMKLAGTLVIYSMSPQVQSIPPFGYSRLVGSARGRTDK